MTFDSIIILLFSYLVLVVKWKDLVLMTFDSVIILLFSYLVLTRVTVKWKDLI